MPKRIQRKRTKGWRMPENAIYVGRGSKWGNPYFVTKVTQVAHEERFAVRSNQEAVEKFNNEICLLKLDHPKCVLWFDMNDLAELKGKDLACWCRLDHVCHGDVLLEMANKEM